MTNAEQKSILEKYPGSYPGVATNTKPVERPSQVSGTLERSKVRTRSCAIDAKMRSQNFSATNGYGNASDIVQEWLSPHEPFQGDYSAFKTLSNEEKVAVVRREAETYGIEKPQGYSVSFHYNANVEYHHFGSSHPMKPWRLTLTKQLVTSYGLEYAMQLHEPRPATIDELALFHDREYLDFLKE